MALYSLMISNQLSSKLSPPEVVSNAANAKIQLEDNMFEGMLTCALRVLDLRA